MEVTVSRVIAHLGGVVVCRIRSLSAVITGIIWVVCYVVAMYNFRLTCFRGGFFVILSCAER